MGLLAPELTPYMFTAQELLKRQCFERVCVCVGVTGQFMACVMFVWQLTRS